MQKVILFMIALVFTTACEKEEIQPATASQKEETPAKSLIGKWEWIRTDGGIGFHIHETPKTTGQKIVLEFKENNNYLKYINGVLKSQGTYTVSTRKCIHTQEEKPVISIPNELDMMMERMDENKLELSDDNPDGIMSQYKRK